jgi:hypothetical protein
MMIRASVGRRSDIGYYVHRNVAAALETMNATWQTIRRVGCVARPAH